MSAVPQPGDPGQRPVLVVGGGIAGGLLALALADAGLAVTLVDEGFSRATALSYGGVAWWAGAPGALGALIRQAPQAWRALEHRHGPIGWRPCGLRLHGGSVLEGLWRPPFAQVDAVAFRQAVARMLPRAGITVLADRVLGPLERVSGGWRLRLEAQADLEADQVVLAAGAGCLALWPALGQRLRLSWAGVLALETMPAGRPPAGSRWLEQGRRGRLVQPRHWRRRGLEQQAATLQQEAWIVDAGLAPWGQGVLVGQISLVRPLARQAEPPDPAWMEERLRQGLSQLERSLGSLAGPYRQVPVTFCDDGIPLAGPIDAARGLWAFTGFSGAFAQVPVLAPRLAQAMALAASRPKPG
ncbi:FAD-dependent oxidoreductase [Synechococcus sp. CCY9202]|uniref:FAD-dependent oxidoreductase n=1 Tax=Synechococcus sp. CCY9202 TaxID=174698 RepID=UPI002B1F962F|nr:FAD-dependent oxidoreductase [Synechococcus sp. CCY9202]MEA5424162.1 FAD-dependent oxidoreductase [Synechococcus sp. CCY9202]